MSHPQTAATQAATAEPTARPHVPPGVILAIACVANFMVIIDTSIVNVALPAMKTALGLSAADQQWVVDAYLITFGGFLLLAARAGDLFGRKGVFQAGLMVFTAASLAGRPGPGSLAADRGPRRAGHRCRRPGLVEPEPDHRQPPRRPGPHPRAVPVGRGGPLAGAVGVVLGGLLTTELSWRYVLFINVPIGVALLIAAAASLVPSPPARDGARLDLPGALTVTVGVSSLVFAVSQATSKGWGSTPVIAALTARRDPPGHLRNDRGPQRGPARPAQHPAAAQPGRGQYRHGLPGCGHDQRLFLPVPLPPADPRLQRAAHRGSHRPYNRAAGGRTASSQAAPATPPAPAS